MPPSLLLFRTLQPHSTFPLHPFPSSNPTPPVPSHFLLFLQPHPLTLPSVPPTTPSHTPFSSSNHTLSHTLLFLQPHSTISLTPPSLPPTPLHHFPHTPFPSSNPLHHFPHTLFLIRFPLTISLTPPSLL